MARTDSIDRRALVDSILKNNGIISAVAKEFGVTAWAIYKYRDKYASVEEAINQARHNLDSALLDGAELKLSEAIRRGDSWAIRYILDKKGEARGYKSVTRQEVAHSVEIATKAYIGISPDDWDSQPTPDA